jgi:DNA-binding MarR family transcriptional regulator
MSSSPTFTPQLLGQTEKALNAILDRLLAGTGVSEPQWIALSLAVTSGQQLLARVSEGLRVDEAVARAHVRELVAAGLLEGPEDGASPVTVTDAGQQLYGRVRGDVAQVTERMWGDLPAEALATTARVLTTILGRANAEVAGSAG